MPSKAHFLVYQYTCTSISYSSSRICFPTHAMYTPLQPACITPGFRKPWNIVKKTLKAIFHEFLHKKKRCSLPCISQDTPLQGARFHTLEQRISCFHRHPYKPLPPGAKYQMTEFDFLTSCQLHFQGVLHCRHVGTLDFEASWISWSTTLWPAGYTLLNSTKDVEFFWVLWQLETVSLRFEVILGDVIGGSECILQNRSYQILKIRATFISDLTLIGQRK